MKTIEKQRVLVENVTERMQYLLEIAEGKRPIEEWNQHASDLLGDVLKETEERDRIAEERGIAKGREMETHNLQAIMDTVVMLHEQEEMTDTAFCKLRDLLHGVALTTPLEDSN